MRYELIFAVLLTTVVITVFVVGVYLRFYSEVFNIFRYKNAEVQGGIVYLDEMDDSTSTIEKVVREATESYAQASTSVRKFRESFDLPYIVNETDHKSRSSDAYWWVSSGGYFYSREGVGSTVVGDLPAQDKRRIDYSYSNPRDTDGGYHPQNVFRLVLKSVWRDFQQEAYFKVINDNLSASEYRNESNGLLFFNRYQDAFNLYYTGIRVDGYATIKKKIDGIYYTLAQERFDTTSNIYSREISSTLLPKQKWIGLKSVVYTNADSTVTIKLYADFGRMGNWIFLLEAVDDGVRFGGDVFRDGNAGIRTDFMDVEFDDYYIESL
jgi:hypothetical protein